MVVPTTRERLATHLPAFGLEVRTPRLTLRAPDDDDLVDLVELATEGVHDPDDMPFETAWTAVPSPQRERNGLGWVWRTRTTLQSDDWHLSLVVVVDDAVVGVQDVQARAWSKTRTGVTGSWLGRAHQGKGIGTEMRHAILQLFFDGFGGAEALTFAFDDNPASLGVTRALGYRANGADVVADALGDGSRTQLRFRMTADDFATIRREDIEIVGAEAVAAVFGTERTPPMT